MPRHFKVHFLAGLKHQHRHGHRHRRHRQLVTMAAACLRHISLHGHGVYDITAPKRTGVHAVVSELV